jgi:hypothetical protein
MIERPALRFVTLSAMQRWLASASLALAAALPMQVSAQDNDLPARVGRVADFAGQLSLSSQERPADWEAIGINYPIASGANLWVSGDGRAEIDYGGGQFRLAGDTNAHVSRLDDSELGLFIAQGQVIVRVRVQEPGDATRIDTPNVQVTLARPGLYRIEVASDRQATTVAVREGEAILAFANGTQQTLPGQIASIVGPNPAHADIGSAQGMDGFDAWSAERDRRYSRARSATYVSRRMVGYADLDDYGSWQTYPEYGPVWFPTTVAPGWAPYRDGYWTEVGPWGAAWVDQAPWGYAPFHYGRWAHVSGRWGWCPGTYVARPVWAPALVAWYGGANWAPSIGRGAPVYGWVPLGWREAYHPAWRRCSFNCWVHYNRPYAVNVTARSTAPPSRHANLAVPGAMSAVPANTLAGRRPVPANLLQVPTSLATSAPVISAAPPFGPRMRPTPTTAERRDIPPSAASTYAGPQRQEPGNLRAGPRPGTPVNPGSPPSQYRGMAPAPAVPTSSGVPASRVPPPARVAPPILPSLSGSAGVASPKTVSPAAVAPLPNANGQAAPVAPANVRGARAGGERSAPEPAPIVPNAIK